MKGKISKRAICVPTVNSAALWPEFSARLRKQGIPTENALILDSASTDGTPDLARRDGFRVVEISRSDFRHGGTRQLGVDLLNDADVIVFLTQDALLTSDDAIAKLISCFEDPRVGAAYGRQLPRPGASLIEAHARHFNYPPESAVKTLDDAPRYGFKSIFFSNSFGAYRRSALMEVGGFLKEARFGEDTIAAARLLMAGWKIVYSAEAKVYHSHAYSIAEEYRRYVQIGQLHATQPWLHEKFGAVRGEGMRFLRSQFKMLAHEAPFQVPEALLRAAAKWIGYRVGLKET